MRWNIRPKPQLGDRRVRELFALWPTRIGQQYVWLEHYFVVEEYGEYDDYDGEFPCVSHGWLTVERTFERPEEPEQQRQEQGVAYVGGEET